MYGPRARPRVVRRLVPKKASSFAALVTQLIRRLSSLRTKPYASKLRVHLIASTRHPNVRVVWIGKVVPVRVKSRHGPWYSITTS